MNVPKRSHNQPTSPNGENSNHDEPSIPFQQNTEVSSTPFHVKKMEISKYDMKNNKGKLDNDPKEIIIDDESNSHNDNMVKDFFLQTVFCPPSSPSQVLACYKEYCKMYCSNLVLVNQVFTKYNNIEETFA